MLRRIVLLIVLTPLTIVGLILALSSLALHLTGGGIQGASEAAYILTVAAAILLAGPAIWLAARIGKAFTGLPIGT